MATTATPELEPEQSPPTNGLKRRQSEVSEQENKRLRTSPGKTSPDPETSRARDAPSEERSRRGSTKGEQAQEPRRKSSAVNEKDRSRRLFGGLLGSLSQKGDNRTTKRRQEIESRKKAELQRQDDEHVEDKQKRLEQLAEKRRRAKKEMQEETMRNRHRDMLQKANFLHTSAQPRLFYKPWELRDDEEDIIDEQIRTAKTQIEDELATADGTAKPSTELNESGSNEPITDQKPDAEDVSPATAEQRGATEQNAEVEVKSTAPSNGTENKTASPVGELKDKELSPSHTNGHNAAAVAESERDSSAAHQDEHDDHVVEGEEDTVIY